MSKELYIGIVGWSETARHMLEFFHKDLRGTEVLALATTDAQGRKYATEVMGLKHVYGDARALYELHQLNVICICSPGEFHLDDVSRSLAAGVDLIIDNPLAINVEDCLQIEQVVRRYPSQKVLLSLPYRIDDQLRYVKREIKEGKLGQIISVNITHRKPLESAHGYLHKGIFMDITLQDIDLVRWLTDREFIQVFAKGSAKKYEHIARQSDLDSALVVGTMQDNILVNFHSTCVQEGPEELTISVQGTTSTVSYTTQSNTFTVGGQVQNVGSTRLIENEKNLWSHYVNLLTGGNRLPNTLNAGTEATKVAVAMAKSHILGNVVNLD